MQENLETSGSMINIEMNSTGSLCNDIGKKLEKNNISTGIIYKAICLVNNKIYIGVTSRKLNVRINEHVKSSKKDPKFLFNRAIKKYGKEKFIFSEIDAYNTIEERDNKEIEYIAEYNSFYLTGHGYNMTLGGDGSTGHVKSPEAIEKIRQARAKQIFSPETRALWSKNRTGRKLTIEQRKYMSKRMIETGCHKKTDEHKQKLRKASSGRIYSPETCLKKSRSMMGKNKKVISQDNMDLIQCLYRDMGLHKVRSELVNRGIFISPGRIKRNLQSINMYRTPIEAKLRMISSMTGRKRGKYKKHAT